MPQEITGQIFSIAATIFTAISYQVNTKKSLLTIQSIATACTCISYLLLGATSGFLLNIVCLVRNLCFFFQKQGHLPIYISSSVFILIMIGLGAISWQGVISLLVIVALALNTFFISLGNPQILRYSILFTSTLVIIYNIYMLVIGSILNEAIAIVSSAIGIIRFRKEKSAEKNTAYQCKIKAKI